MALFSERQQTAAALTRAINVMEGAWVVSTPLADKIRFQVLDSDRNRVLQQLKDWGWEPRFVSILPRVTPVGMVVGSAYEIELPKEQQAIADDRTIKGELPSKEPPSHEVQAILDDWYGKKKLKR